MECNKKEAKKVSLYSRLSVMAQRSLPNARSYPLPPSPSRRPPLYASPQHRSSRAQVQVQAQEEPSFLHYDHRSEVVHQAVLARHRRSVELPIKRELGR